MPTGLSDAENLVLADIRKTPGVQKLEVLKLEIYPLPLLGPQERWAVKGDARIDDLGGNLSFDYAVDLAGNLTSKKLAPWYRGPT